MILDKLFLKDEGIRQIYSFPSWEWECHSWTPCWWNVNYDSVSSFNMGITNRKKGEDLDESIQTDEDNTGKTSPRKSQE